jgi:hypothetical protein
VQVNLVDLQDLILVLVLVVMEPHLQLLELQ